MSNKVSMLYRDFIKNIKDILNISNSPSDIKVNVNGTLNTTELSNKTVKGNKIDEILNIIIITGLVLSFIVLLGLFYKIMSANGDVNNISPVSDENIESDEFEEYSDNILKTGQNMINNTKKTINNITLSF